MSISELSKERMEELEAVAQRLTEAVESFCVALTAVSEARQREEDDSAEQSILMDARLEIAKAGREASRAFPDLIRLARLAAVRGEEVKAWRRTSEANAALPEWCELKLARRATDAAEGRE